MSEQSKNSAILDPKTPGEMLRIARKKRGLQQSAVAERMRLSVQTIIDIESDDYTHFAAEIYLRGHIRSFSRIVNLDENKVLQCYELLGVVFESDNPVRLLESQTIPVSSATRRSKRQGLLWVSLTVLLILVVMVVLWWREQKSHTSPISRSVNTQTIPITTANTDNPIKPLAIAKKATRVKAHHRKTQKIISHTTMLAKKKKTHSNINFKNFVPDYHIAPVKR